VISSVFKSPSPFYRILGSNILKIDIKGYLPTPLGSFVNSAYKAPYRTE
jgi:hypothetical protein